MCNKNHKLHSYFIVTQLKKYPNHLSLTIFNAVHFLLLLRHLITIVLLLKALQRKYLFLEVQQFKEQGFK